MCTPPFLVDVGFMTNEGEVLLSHLTCCRVDKNTYLGRKEERKEKKGRRGKERGEDKEGRGEEKGREEGGRKGGGRGEEEGVCGCEVVGGI